MKAVADTLGVSRSNLVEPRQIKAAQAHRKAEDAELLRIIRRLVDQRPTYGYRRIAALLNRERRATASSPISAPSPMLRPRWRAVDDGSDERTSSVTSHRSRAAGGLMIWLGDVVRKPIVIHGLGDIE